MVEDYILTSLVPWEKKKKKVLWQQSSNSICSIFVRLLFATVGEIVAFCNSVQKLLSNFFENCYLSNYLWVVRKVTVWQNSP